MLKGRYILAVYMVGLGVAGCVHSVVIPQGSPSASPSQVAGESVDPQVTPEELGQFSELLLGLVDRIPALKEVGLKCHRWGLKAISLSQPLHSIWDETVTSLKPSAKARALSWSKSCEADCTCDLYADAVADESEAVPGVKLLRKLSGRKVSNSQRVICASKLKDPCHSVLFKKIDAEGAEAESN